MQLPHVTIESKSTYYFPSSLGISLCTTMKSSTFVNHDDIRTYNALILKPFQANVPFIYPLKTSENLWFSDVFRGV